MTNQYRHASYAICDNKYHIVWIAKYRKKVLIGDIGLRLREIIKQICNKNKIEILKGVISPDHIHLFLETPPCIRCRGLSGI